MIQPKRKISALTTLILLFLIIAGCPGYGTTRYYGRNIEEEKLDRMMAAFEDYRVYYTGLSVGFPSAVIFDPKADDTTVVQEGWTLVEERETAQRLIRNLERYPVHRPYLYSIIGEDERTYGYIYTGYHHIVVRQVDENQVHVLEMHEPPHLRYEPGGRFSRSENRLR